MAGFLSLSGMNGKHEAPEIAAAADTAHQKIGFFPRQFQLLFGFQADHGLMKEHMIQHAS